MYLVKVLRHLHRDQITILVDDTMLKDMPPIFLLDVLDHFEQERLELLEVVDRLIAQLVEGNLDLFVARAFDDFFEQKHVCDQFKND